MTISRELKNLTEVMILSWASELYAVYDKCCGSDGMVPVYHITVNAQIELTINEHGDFMNADVVDKSEAVTVIPVTEQSGGRTSGVCAHTFADKLIYIAGDYSDFVKGKKSDNSKYHQDYLNKLKGWAESEHSHAAVKAVYEYISKGTVMHDLIDSGVLSVNEETGALDESAKIAGVVQADCFVRYRVCYDDFTLDTATWNDVSLYDSFVQYNSQNLGEPQLCYATGKMLPCTYNHPYKIRNAGDKAKLISTNDENGFSYRGRFDNKEQTISVSFDFSQKMHAALRWLLAKQGISIGSLSLVVWESQNVKTFSPLCGAYELTEQDGDEENALPDTYAGYRNFLQKAIFGTGTIEPQRKTMIMGVDAATTGRLSVALYSELSTSDFLQNLNSWHENTACLRFNAKTKKYYITSFPLRGILECAYGNEQEKKITMKSEILRDQMCRLIPCVTEGRNIPQDIVNALYIKASNPLAYDEQRNWRMVLDTAFGMIRKSYIEKGENITMGLDKDCRDRNYLYGRLLALADKIEYDAYDPEDKGTRVTNARRYMNRFSERPFQTWKMIRERVEPYLEKKNTAFYTYIEREINDKLEVDVCSDNSPLNGLYLLGYNHQWNDFYKTSSMNNEEE